ncbi:DUF2848 domain-containing protein [Spongiactinospora gelatinilytica]|uniref:DUF2848 domain-containing protein n=1 Tax=Spongiactinospora gelatinilytica TaxID=2666298 RepID=A0A2W2G3W7_9ACTN|nr:DUF2848 family protein [Spongiactinospora gelatinilytica]PZG31638.1 DUF2848 domain-containing protein [Spongiactinospora gelatinilytica]
MIDRSTAVTVDVADTGERLTFAPDKLIVAGYTAHDLAAVEAHIAELAAIGVPRPASVPSFYDLDVALLTTDPVVEVDGASTSGEVEPVLIRAGDRYFLGVGSDHTDRELERTDVAESKAACPKPIASTVVELGPGLSALDWDALDVSCSVDGAPYQRGGVSALRHPAELLDRMTDAVGSVWPSFVLFCGTLPLLSGTFVHGSHWQVRLELPGGRDLTHAYEIKQRSL